MNGTAQDFIYVSVVMITLTVLELIPIIIWAVRSGQFKNQDHARYLPLRGHIPKEEE